jgi:hypothetical protein
MNAPNQRINTAHNIGAVCPGCGPVMRIVVFCYKENTNMPTPKVYKNIAERISNAKWYFLSSFVLGLLVCIAPTYISPGNKINPAPLIGVGLLISVWGWGLFLTVNWFHEKASIASGISKTIRFVSDWIGALFLDLLFIVGSASAIQLVLRSYTK